MPTNTEEHYCGNISAFPINKFHQLGSDEGRSILIVGESPAENGWRKSGKAFYTPEGKILPTGKRLNLLLSEFNLSVEKCGFTELSKCFIGKNRKSLNKCCQLCWPIFIKQLESVNCKLIFILGVKTLEIFNRLCNTTVNTGDLTKIYINGKSYFILPIYHPSPINPYSQKINEKIFSLLKKKLKEIIFQ
jgi:uracil-DNA glycosylase family 4